MKLSDDFTECDFCDTAYHPDSKELIKGNYDVHICVDCIQRLGQEVRKKVSEHFRGIGSLCPNCKSRLRQDVALLDKKTKEIIVIKAPERWECSDTQIDGFYLHCPNCNFREFASFEDLK